MHRKYASCSGLLPIYFLLASSVPYRSPCLCCLPASLISRSRYTSADGKGEVACCSESTVSSICRGIYPLSNSKDFPREYYLSIPIPKGFTHTQYIYKIIEFNFLSGHLWVGRCKRSPFFKLILPIILMSNWARRWSTSTASELLVQMQQSMDKVNQRSQINFTWLFDTIMQSLACWFGWHKPPWIGQSAV